MKKDFIRYYRSETYLEVIVNDDSLLQARIVNSRDRDFENNKLQL